jgi:hypothetical protein
MPTVVADARLAAEYPFQARVCAAQRAVNFDLTRKRGEHCTVYSL